MPAAKIMVIRHAEKPNGRDDGVLPTGKRNADSLIVRGWERAGALATLFAPARGPLQDPRLATPGFLYAAKTNARKHSHRPYQTLLPLAAKLGLTINDAFKKDEYELMLVDAGACDGVVLVAWQQEFIPQIGNTIAGNDTTVPQKWPSSRFDMVWIFTSSGGDYAFAQVPELLLEGDSKDPFS
jgi:hypothetical protein